MPRALTFADRLRELREAAGLSQYELARRTGLSKQTLSKLEQGGRDPAWSTVRLLAKVLGVAVTAFEVGDVVLPGDAATLPPTPSHAPGAGHSPRRERRRAPQ